MQTLDISLKLPSSFTEKELNDLLQDYWMEYTYIKRLKCTVTQKHCIGMFGGDKTYDSDFGPIVIAVK